MSQPRATICICMAKVAAMLPSQSSRKSLKIREENMPVCFASATAKLRLNGCQPLPGQRVAGQHPDRQEVADRHGDAVGDRQLEEDAVGYLAPVGCRAGSR